MMVTVMERRQEESVVVLEDTDSNLGPKGFWACMQPNVGRYCPIVNVERISIRGDEGWVGVRYWVCWVSMVMGITLNSVQHSGCMCVVWESLLSAASFEGFGSYGRQSGLLGLQY
ncbi:hypothetical protein ARMGADRAFT_1040341 [Armillaria gallica]|uniref:Uncharacterized protein n=1 Tax=Armillaria gallica TaxID=47427 RepID=A0A2H3CLM3_ARMGA|nr:hypothetical protein ARMGADRAFT_1040341 [Armillaria gallica]